MSTIFMELNLRQLLFDPECYTPREIEECLEDPFGIRILPEDVAWTQETRYFCLAKSLSGRGLFLVFWSDGKSVRIVSVRDMTEVEEMYYKRKYTEMR
ncbi:MAG: BrnT family toxin [Akkermansia sp.]